jgi:prepilin-type processing-associated H-X9-DG protein
MSLNLERWHGRRTRISEPFDASKGPLVAYLGADGGIRACPALEPDLTTNPAHHFEAGCGGYGYNTRFLGVRDPFRFDRSEKNTLSGARADAVRRPGETVMFTDSAFAAESLIEYSFAEPRFHPQFGNRADPSIHFRHGHRANIVWCDGHVSAESPTFSWSSGFYSMRPERFNIGWFGEADDNGFFDLQ